MSELSTHTHIRSIMRGVGLDVGGVFDNKYESGAGLYIDIIS